MTETARFPSDLPRLGPPSPGDAEARFAGPVERRWADAGEGRTLAYAEAGSGPPVILIHGALTMLDDMVLGPFDLLAETHRVIAFDRPGHGGSKRRRLLDGTPWRQATLIHNAAISLGVERAVIVGHSYGGAVATAYGLMFPEDTAGIVAMAPIAVPEPRLEHFLFGPRATLGVGGALAAMGRETVDRALLPTLWRAMFLPQPMPERFRREFPFQLAGRPETTLATGEDAMGVASLMANVASYPRLKPPLRVLGGDSDLVVNNTLHGITLSRLAPHGRFTSLRVMGHQLHHFAGDAVAAAVEEVGREGG